MAERYDGQVGDATHPSGGHWEPPSRHSIPQSYDTWYEDAEAARVQAVNVRRWAEAGWDDEQYDAEAIAEYEEPLDPDEGGWDAE